MQKALEQLTPQKYNVPSKSNIQILYQANGESPILAVRIQEIFGMADTPRINDGKIALVFHLFSPGLKPVQVTSDLRSL
jgi:ATP-dependent helicase HrpB